MLLDKIEIEIIDSFYSKIMGNKRKIRVYLPPSYSEKNSKKYPVLYIHDGQNVFDDSQSFSGISWKLHQKAEYLIKNKIIDELIIAAVDNMGEERLSEYAHQDGFYKGEKVKAKALKYQRFLIEELMPYLEEKYRIKKGAANTALMGSSMGGLVTLNIALKRPDIFAKAAVMSPSLWWGTNTALEKLKSFNFKNLNSKIWLDVGEAENTFANFTEEFLAELKKIKNDYKLNLIYYQAADAVHNEAAWAQRVHCPLIYFFAKKARIEKIEIKGKGIIKLNNNNKYRLNPVVNYSNSFKMTALNGEFSSLTPELLTVNNLGSLKIKKRGLASVAYNFQGHSALKKLRII